jgi:hypothetical protein
MMSEGIGMELAGIDLGDKRLNQRSIRVLETLYANPEASINAACDGWGDTLAAYRLFDNAAVEPEKVLASHIQKTRERVKEHPIVLVVQDTTELDFGRHAPQDARCLDKYRFGLFDHTYLAVTPDRLCLGVVGGEQFDRSPESLGKTRERRTLPIEQKESFRWLTGYRKATQLAQDCPTTRIISIADCEADIYDIFVEAQQTGATDFIIRAKEDRCTPERDPLAGPAVYRKVMDEVRASPVRAERTVELSQTPKRAARQAELKIRAISVTVRPPQARSHLPTVTYNVVLVEEINGPGDGTDVSWLLITTLPIDTAEQILLVIDYYVARWTIEIFFRVLKSGCKVEKIQLETLARVKNCLAFYKIIAWRVMYLTFLNRECPELPCTAAFDDCEWQPVWHVVKKEPLPPKPPSLGEFMKLIARLGGYNNRPKEPPPGPQVIWTGLRRMADFALAWTAFQQVNEPRCV